MATRKRQDAAPRPSNRSSKSGASSIAKQRESIFVSYSHKDGAWVERLRVHLAPVTRDGSVRLWSDTEIKAGQTWRSTIKQELQAAKVAVLLISADFLASEFVAKEELPPLLAAADADGAVILPLIVKPSRFLRTPGLKDYQAVNDPATPLSDMTETQQENTFVELTDRILEVLHGNAGAEETEPSEEEGDLPPEHAEVFHPSNRVATRSELEPCKFFVSPFYKERSLWDLYGDIEVELQREQNKGRVYLIPSGAAAPRLRDARFLRTKDGKEVVAQKKTVGDEFVAATRNQVLPGFSFKMRTKEGEVRTKVYCPLYDAMLQGRAS